MKHLLALILAAQFLPGQLPDKNLKMIVNFGIVRVQLYDLKAPITMNDMLKAQIDAQNRFSSAILEIREINTERVDAILVKYKVELDLKGIQ